MAQVWGPDGLWRPTTSLRYLFKRTRRNLDAFQVQEVLIFFYVAEPYVGALTQRHLHQLVSEVLESEDHISW